MSHPPSTFAVIVPVAATDQDWNRLPDLLDSLCHYEDAIDEIVILDDAQTARPLPTARLPLKITRLPNIRAGRGNGWSGGLCAGLVAAYSYLHTNSPQSRHFVLRIDTDALVIAPFFHRIKAIFREHPDVAMLGSFLLSPNGKPRGYEYWGQLLNDMLHPWLRGSRRKRTGRPLPTNLWGRPARIRRIIRMAMAHGYILGQSVQGGAYAISSAALRNLHNHHFLDDPLLWLNTDLVEDVLFSMLVMATGMQLRGFAANGEAFGVLHKGLPDLPQPLLDRGYSIIHSIRNDPRLTEDQIRQFYRNTRASHSPIPTAANEPPV